MTLVTDHGTINISNCFYNYDKREKVQAVSNLIDFFISLSLQSFGLFIGALVLNFKNARYIAFTYFMVSVLAGSFNIYSVSCFLKCSYFYTKGDHIMIETLLSTILYLFPKRSIILP